MIVASRTDPSRGMGTRLYTCRCVDLGSTKTSFLSVGRMQGPSMEARFTVGKSLNRTTRPGGLSTGGFLPHLGGGGAGTPSILYFPLDTFSRLFYDPANTPWIVEEAGKRVKG